MTKQGAWSEAPTQIHSHRRAARPPVASFDEPVVRTVVEPPDPVAAQAYASAVAAERGAQLAELAHAQPETPERQPISQAHALRRLTLTPLALAGTGAQAEHRPTLAPRAITDDSVMPPPLAPISHRPPLAPPRAERPSMRPKYLFVARVGLIGLTVAMAMVLLLHATLAIG
jgi:hypothetical protein